jgi:PAS domain S-box-containing protein
MRTLNLKRSLVLLFIVVCVTVNIAALVLYLRYERVKESSAWVTHTNEVISQIQGLYGLTEKLVAVQRGYLITSDKGFLSAYDQTSEAITIKLKTLFELTKDNYIQLANIKIIQADTADLKVLLQGKIALRKTVRNSDIVDIQNDTRQVTALADAIRTKTTVMLDNERNVLLQRQKQEKAEENYYIATIFITSLISVGVLILANGLIFGMAIRQRTISRDLEETRERLELAVEATNDGVFDWDLKNDVVFYSPRFRDMLGYSPDEITNSIEDFLKLIHSEDKDRVAKKIDDYLHHRISEYRAEFRILHKDGFWRWHLARKRAVFDDKGKAYRLVGAHTDITQEKASEEFLRASNRELENFTYIASHDLRSPLVNLKGFASEIETAMQIVTPFVEKHLSADEQTKNPEVKTAVEEDIPLALNFIKTSVTRMEKLTRAILELSRVGRRQLVFEPLNVRSIIDSCIKTLQHQIKDRKIKIMIGDTPEIIGDAVAIEQVFGNVIDNAVKYLDPERPGIIRIAGIQTSSDTLYTIEDNGRGIRLEDQAKVFELFKRVGRHDNIPGEGMGMSYVQTILRRHNGMIWLESEPDRGTIFYFSIPNKFYKEKTDV